MTAENDLETEITPESRCSHTIKELSSELGKLREEINYRATATNNQHEEELFNILALRLAETERHLEAMVIARNPESGFSVEKMLDEIDEELVSDGIGFRLEHGDQS